METKWHKIHFANKYKFNTKQNAKYLKENFKNGNITSNLQRGQKQSKIGKKETILFTKQKKNMDLI